MCVYGLNVCVCMYVCIYVCVCMCVSFSVCVCGWVGVDGRKFIQRHQKIANQEVMHIYSKVIDLITKACFITKAVES